MDRASLPSPSSEAASLVGRDRERAVVRDCLAAALDGRGGLVLVGGEAGIGKTALVAALAREATDAGALALAGHCYDLTITPPYGPWVDLLAGYRPAGDDLPPVPAFLHDRTALAALGGQAALFAETAAFFFAAAAGRPLVLVLEDLHWADQASLDLLRALARQLAPHRLLLLATYRVDELTRHHPLYPLLPLLVREARAARVDLRALDAAAVRALLAARYLLPAGEADRLAAYLGAHAEGNPLYAGELLRALEEEGVLRPGGDGWRLGELAHVRIPPLLQQVIDGRLDRLGEAAREALAVAAVIGQEAPLDLWRAIGDLAEDALPAVVERAAEARLLAETPDGTRARFAHALIREALYQGVLPSRRRGWHRRIAEHLVAAPRPDPDAVAHHFQQAGDARAGEWLVAAGERAQRAYAWLTAAERFEAALALMEGREADAGARGWLLFRLARLRRYDDPRRGLAYVDEAARLATEARDPVLAAYCRFHGGLLRCFDGDARRGLAELAAGCDAVDALAPADRARLRELAMVVGISPDGHRGTLAQRLGETGRYAEALAQAERAGASGLTPAAGQLWRGSGHADGRQGAGLAHAALGRPGEARRAHAEARAAYRAVEHHLLVGNTAFNELALVALPYHTDRIAERRALAAEAEEAWRRASGAAAGNPRSAWLPLLVLEGQWAEARRLAEAAAALGGQSILLLFLGSLLALLARGRGEPVLAWRLVRAQLPDGHATEPGDASLLLTLPLLRLAAALALDAGDLPTARAWLATHDRWLDWGAVVQGRAEAALGWAAYHRAAGDLAQAREHAEQALTHAGEPRQPLALLAAHRALGELATAAGDHAEAATHLAESLALADACVAVYERALTLLATAELRAATGKREAAEAALAEARAILEPLEARPALARAAALAARLAAPAVPPAAYPAGLSAREVEVLRLVAEGLTDAQVAARLFLSPRTVGQHLRSVYTKLGVDNRAAATRFAVAHGLA